MPSVMIDGVRYVPDESIPDAVKFYFLHDCHMFTLLRGSTIDEVLAHADEIERSEAGSYGMLCPALLMRGRREIRRVGPPVHAGGSRDPKDVWQEGKAKWKEAMEKDPDVMRLLATRNNDEIS